MGNSEMQLFTYFKGPLSIEGIHIGRQKSPGT